MQADLIALAERCEQLAGPDREVDALIAPLQGLRVVDEGHPIGRTCYDGVGRAQLLPRYTASIDAAMSLVPADMRDEIEITTLYLVARVTINMNHGSDGCPFYGSNESNSIPLAICAAALRARAISETTHG